MVDRLVVGSEADLESCILPCSSSDHGVPVPPWVRHYGYEPVDNGRYRMTPLDRDRLMPTSYLVGIAEPRDTVERFPDGGRRHDFSHLWYREELCQNRQPGQHYNVLQVGGPRTMTYAGQPWQCYVAWRPDEGGEPVALDVMPSPREGISVLALKHGAGCLYACMARSGPGGKPAGFTTLVVVIETQLFRGPPDSLQLDLYGHTWDHETPDEEIEFPRVLTSVKPAWRSAYAAARDGFRRECGSGPLVAPAFEPAADTETEAAFVALVTDGRDWAGALDAVEAAWQLMTVCQHVQPAEFAHRPTPYKRAKLMLDRYRADRPDRADRIDSLWAVVGAELMRVQTASY